MSDDSYSARLKRTFTVPLADIIAANHPGFLQHVERNGAGKVALYASLPACTAPPVRVRRNLRIGDGWHRVAAARLRGDVDVLCYPASAQEELSA
jgi:hypothetical protein